MGWCWPGGEVEGEYIKSHPVSIVTPSLMVSVDVKHHVYFISSQFTPFSPPWTLSSKTSLTVVMD